MQNNNTNNTYWVKGYTKRSKNRRLWKNFVRVMAYVVVFCTTYALILPAITMEYGNTCGLEEHTHSQACFRQDEITEMICTLEECEAHSHTESCYATAGHEHSDDCYVVVQGELICQETDESHSHGESCYEATQQVVCGLEEAPVQQVLICTDDTQAHQHGDDCVKITYEEVQICTLEEHTHTLACHSHPDADLETAEDWEKTLKDVELTGVWTDDLIAVAKSQIGYTESKKNYLTEDGETKQGYSRYGAWFGVPYGGWDVMFASFCLNYAGIPKEAVPHDSSAEKWVQALAELKLLDPAEDRVPKLGDLIFFADETGKITGVEIIIDLITGKDKTISEIKTIGGDRDNQVSRGRYEADDASIAAYCGMDKALERFVEKYPEEAEALGLLQDDLLSEKVTQTAETENYLVTVTYSADLVMPEGAELRVVEYDKDSDIFRQRCEEAGYELEWLLNIGFFLGEDELELDGAFDVVVTSKQGEALGSDITHFTDEGAELIEGEETEVEAEDGQTAVSFSSSSFSDFGGGTARATCEHTFTYEVIGVKVVATCSKSDCGYAKTIDGTSSVENVNAYADQLRQANANYSDGSLSWDSEAKGKGWTYYNGVMMDAFMKVGTQAMTTFAIDFYDKVLTVDGTPIGYGANEVDSVPMALALFDLLDRNQSDRRYQTAIHYVYTQLSGQEKLGEEYGKNYWHKMESASWATWKFGLDGLYMAMPFEMEYANAIASGRLDENRQKIDPATVYKSVYDRLTWVSNTMYDQYTGLFHHGWNGNNGNGVFWGRGLGWYAMALVEVIDLMPDTYSVYKTNLIGQLTKLFDGMLQYQDASTGMWYNVVDHDSSLSGNRLETSVSSMMAYTMMKAYQEGWVGAEYYAAGMRALIGVTDNKMEVNAGSYTVNGTYLKASVYDDVTKYLVEDYYKTPHEAKGVGALIMAAQAAVGADDETAGGSGTTGPAHTSTVQKITQYTFQTLNPNSLSNGDKVVIYCSSATNAYTFLYSTNTGPLIDRTAKVNGNNPTTIDGTWTVSADQLGYSLKALTFQVVKDGNTTRLKMLDNAKDRYLCLYAADEGKNYTLSSAEQITDSHNTLSITRVDKNYGSKDAAAHVTHNVNRNNKIYDLYVRYANGEWEAGTDNMKIYFAKVTKVTYGIVDEGYHPQAVSTGVPSVDTLRFYNFVEVGGQTVKALPGCQFVITGDNYRLTLISDNNPELRLPSTIPDGTYTIEEVSVPDGYIRDVNPKRTFTIGPGADGKKVFSDGTSIGRFLNHASDLMSADKVAEVQDYNNRTYQIMMTAESNLRLYQMEPVDVLFVVDQSNSMLFPAGLQETGSSIELEWNKGVLWDNTPGGNTKNTSKFETLVAAGKLDRNGLYYIIADESATSTVYAVWYNGTDWMYQDASYYAKAYHDNVVGYRQDNEEYAIFPEVKSVSEQPKSQTRWVNKEITVDVKANGGSFSYQIGHTLGDTDLANHAEHKITYKIYTAVDGFNRLHYLQDALANSVHQLADANAESTVSLIRFTKTTDHDECIGPLKLNAANVKQLVEAVGDIYTSGGTRQDIALQHTYEHLDGTQVCTDENGEVLEYTKDSNHTFTVLITDGAPVISNESPLYLGDCEDPKATTDNVNTMVQYTTSSPSAADRTNVRGQNQEKDLTVYSCIKYWGDKVGIRTIDLDGSNDNDSKSVLMTIGLGMGAVEGGSKVLGQIATDGKDGSYHVIMDDAAQLMKMLETLLYSSMRPREKVDLMADISDVISDSFYPIAWVPEGTAPKNRALLTMKDPQDTENDWIILEPDDWITCEGRYVGPKRESDGLYGIGQLQLVKNKDGTEDYQIFWDDQMLYDCELVWVSTLEDLPAGRRVVLEEPNLGTYNRKTYGRYWFHLEIGDEIYAHGEYVNPAKKNQRNGTSVYYNFVTSGMKYKVVAKYVQSKGDPRPHLDWTDYYSVDFDANFQPYLWHGKFYVKAKEDFIGGNAIDTNKSAVVAGQQNDGIPDEAIHTIYLDTPTVNVRLLPMNEETSEVTVFLGDMINGVPKAEEGQTEPGKTPLESLQYFFENTHFEKLLTDISGQELDMNKVAPNSADDGLLPSVFYLRYAIAEHLTDKGKLTDTQWGNLMAGESITMEYTYDGDSSHGPVGYFTFQLSKTGKSAAYEAHEATVACKQQHEHTGFDTPAETYTLHVTYTAYKLGENGRPATTVHNDDKDIDNDGKDAGTEVGTGTTLPTGLGVVPKADVHKVHVISGAVVVNKEITGALVNPDQDQTFTFTLRRLEEGNDFDEDELPTLTVLIEKGSTTGVGRLDGLKRGTWILTEKNSKTSQIRYLTVDSDKTNCDYVTNGSEKLPATTATFYIGTNEETDVIGGGQASSGTIISTVDTIPVTPVYTVYADSPNGVLGVISKALNDEIQYVGKVPVQKNWTGVAEDDIKDLTIYVVLYELDKTDDGTVISRRLLTEKVDDDQRAVLVKLDASTGWKGEFTVSLQDADDRITDHEYEIREVCNVTDQRTEDATNEGVLSERDPETGELIEVWYGREVEPNKFVSLGVGRDYLVEYGEVENEPAKPGEAGTQTPVYDKTLTVTNHLARVMPESGGTGTKMYTFGGLLLILTAALMYGYDQRRKRERGPVE